MEIESKEFRNQEITVTYDPCICKLSGKCARGLSDVFSDNVIPWINLDGSETDNIINQIKKCPSGALRYYKNHHQMAV